jgi:pentapeptide MXKDX repeat protein
MRCRVGWLWAGAIRSTTEEPTMNAFARVVLSCCVALAATGALAQDAMKKNDPMHKDGMAKKEMTLQQCKDHMAMAKKDGMKDDAAMKTDKMCSDMMKKDHMSKDGMMKKDDMMKKDGMAADPMKK